MNIFFKIKRNLLHPVQGEIWCLHRVVHEKSIFKENYELEISETFLEDRIVQFLKLGYRFISLEDAIVELGHYPGIFHKKFIHVTFDDGYSDIYKYAYPIFKKYKIPFTIYLTTNLVEHKMFCWWEALEQIILENEDISLSTGKTIHCSSLQEKQDLYTQVYNAIFKQNTSPEIAFKIWFDKYHKYYELEHSSGLDYFQIKEMINSGLCVIGDHTMSHIDLTKVKHEKIVQEVVNSRKIMEVKLGVHIDHFSYPFSACNNKTEKYIYDATYQSAVIGYGGKCRYIRHRDMFKIPRVYVVE